MKKLKNGTFKGTVDLEKDNSYEFRYVVDGQWTNDDQADAYAWSDFAAAAASWSHTPASDDQRRFVKLLRGNGEWPRSDSGSHGV